MMMTVITRRSGDLKKSNRTAEEGSKYIAERFIKEFVDEVGEQNARKVIAHVVLERYRTDNLEIDQEDVIEIEEEESISDLSGETGVRTTQSTRDRLELSERRVAELTEQLQDQHIRVAQAPESEIGDSRSEATVIPDKARTTGGGRNPPAGEGH